MEMDFSHLKVGNIMNNTIGICGQGFVGTAVREGMKHSCFCWTYDKFRKDLSNVADLDELLDMANVIFVCVPTPMFYDGKCDTSIVESVLKEINEISKVCTENKVVVIKSTVPPGTTKYFNETYKDIDIVFNPEFLTEKNSIQDFKDQNRIILGGKSAGVYKLESIYRDAYPNVPILRMDSTSAEMVKYITNCFLATKVSFFNEMKQIMDKLNISYEEVIEAAKFDERLGKSHMQVPGPDGAYGFGLSCFPKDLNALTYAAKSLGIKTTMLEATWKKNLEVRKPEDRDWEKMSKAVVNPKTELI